MVGNGIIIDLSARYLFCDDFVCVVTYSVCATRCSTDDDGFVQPPVSSISRRALSAYRSSPVSRNT